MLAKISDLQERQIINISDGKCLGGIKDIEIDLEKGCIQALILPGNNSLLGLLQSRDEIVIPWHQVVRIGIDVVLVNASNLNGDRQKRQKRLKEEFTDPWQQEVEEFRNETIDIN